MVSKKILLLGIPIDNLTIEETVDKIIDLTKSKNTPPHYIGTLNTQFLDNIFGISWTHPKNLELMEVLQNSALVTPDGAPITWLSSLLGLPLKERVSGADLVPKVCQKLSDIGGSIYFLGGDEVSAKKAASKLQKIYPNLKIAGISCPPIFIQGEHLVESSQRDQLILEEIHKAAPDILMISLGNPKQEIWFERVKNHLQVPVSIGIGGSLNFLSGKVKRAPKSIQKFGFEWLYRLFQEPGRLWLRYFKVLIKLIYLYPPLILYHRMNELYTSLFYQKHPKHVLRNLLFFSTDRSLAIIRFPTIVNGQNTSELKQSIDEAYSQDSIILDFSKTRHLDLEGLSLIFNVARGWQNNGKELLFYGISWSLRLFFILHRIWPLISVNYCPSASSVLKRVAVDSSKMALFESVHQLGNTAVLNFFGRFDNTFNFDTYLDKHLAVIHNKNCLIDLSYCDHIDNTGIGRILELKKTVESEGKLFKVDGIGRKLRRQFKRAGVYDLLTKTEDNSSEIWSEV